MKNLAQKISSICEYSEEALTRDKYSTDASIFEVKPIGVTYPKNIEELKTLVRLADSLANESSVGPVGAADKQLVTKLTLSPRAAGTCMSGGSLTEGIMVDITKGFGEIGDITWDRTTQTSRVWVDAGVYYRDLEKKTLANAESNGGPLIFPAYTSSKDICAVGGMVGNNASGEKSLRYGATIDNVLAVRMVCSNGQEYEFGELNHSEFEAKKKLNSLEGVIYKGIASILSQHSGAIAAAKPQVRKNAAGYGLWNIYKSADGGQEETFNIAKLIVGSQGTLGIVTKVLLNLVPAPKYTDMVVLPIHSLNDLAVAVKEILSHKPEGLETYDDNTYNLAKTYMPTEAGLAARVDGSKLVLFAQFALNTQAATRAAAQECVKSLNSKTGALADRFFQAVIVEDSAEREAHWAIRRASFRLIKNYADGKSRAVPVIEDTIVDVARYGEFLTKLQAILTDYNMKYTFAGHIGDGSIRLIPLVDLTADGAVDKVFDLARRTYELVVEFGGSISVDHNDGLIRTSFLGLMYKPEILELFRRTKYIFDPHGIFNPGKKVFDTSVADSASAAASSLSYAKAHVSKVNKGLI